MPRLVFGLIFVLSSLLSACGLSQKDRAVSDANEAIRAVEVAGQEIASRINELPAEDIEPAAFSALTDAIGVYVERAEMLNAALRGLGEFFPSLSEYVEQTFRPASESALQACQEAMDAFGDENATQEDFRRAVTRVGLCLQRYATAVSNVSAEYSRIPE